MPQRRPGCAASAGVCAPLGAAARPPNEPPGRQTTIAHQGKSVPQTTIFVSYSHQDQRHLQQFQRFMTPLERAGLIGYWDDTRLRGGDDWYDEIDRALRAASVAVLFISQDFIASRFIWNEELPRILARADAGTLKLLPVFLSPATVDDECVYRDENGAQRRRKLAALQGYGTPQKPLRHRSVTWSDRERIYQQICEDLRRMAPADSAAQLAASASGAASGAASDPARVVSARPPLSPPPPASPPRERAAHAYVLNVQLERRDAQLDLRYTLPGSDVIESATLAWQALDPPPAMIAGALDEPGGAALPGELAARWGALLGQLLLGLPAARLARLLRTLFDRPPPAAAPNPSWMPVHLRVCTSDPLLVGLPWRLARWDGVPLVDSGWQFSTSSVADPSEHPVVPAPAGVLIVAPHGAAPGRAKPTPAEATVSALADALRQVWPSPRRAENVRAVRTRSELEDALRGSRCHLIYVCGTLHGDPAVLQLDDGGAAGSLPLAHLAELIARTPTRPAAIYLDLSGQLKDLAVAVLALGELVPLVVWRRVGERQSDSTTIACAWLRCWLQNGLDPLAALHEVLAQHPTSREAATLAVHARYRNWTTVLAAPWRASLPHLKLDRDEQKALLGKHLDELVRSDTRRVLALVAYGSADNLLSELPEQLQYHLERGAERAADINWRRLQFPDSRHELARALEEELRLQLWAQSGETLARVLRRHAPNVTASGRRAVLWLNWGLARRGNGEAGELQPEALSDWLRFTSEVLGAGCPDDLRVVSYLALELDRSAHGELSKQLQDERWRPWGKNPRFRLSVLPPLGEVSEEHLYDFLVEEGSGCDPAIQEEVAQRLVAQTGGCFARVVELIEVAERGSWYDLLERLRQQQDGET